MLVFLAVLVGGGGRSHVQRMANLFIKAFTPFLASPLALINYIDAKANVVL
jgi:hypothetical protein